jgi:hypothetical protein
MSAKLGKHRQDALDAQREDLTRDAQTLQTGIQEHLPRLRPQHSTLKDHEERRSLPTSTRAHHAEIAVENHARVHQHG